MPDASVSVIDATGNVFTVINCDAVDVHPPLPVTVTVYVVLDTGETVMAAVVAPVLHEYVPPPLAVRLAEPPVQTALSLAVPDASVSVIDATGNVFTVINCDAVDVHPPVPVTVTVYVVLDTGETVMAAVVSPVLHE
jgi:hypothetical protein